MSDPLKDIANNGVYIYGTFSETFPVVATCIINALNYRWAKYEADAMVGFANIPISADEMEGLIGSPITIHPCQTR